MTAWTQDDLSRIGRAEELGVSSWRRDGTLRHYVTIWVVRVGDNLYVRTAAGMDNPWFVRAKASGRGRIRAGGIERDVTFEDGALDLAPDSHDAIDAAYHAKYDRYGPRIVGSVVGRHAALGTLRMLPAD